MFLFLDTDDEVEVDKQEDDDDDEVQIISCHLSNKNEKTPTTSGLQAYINSCPDIQPHSAKLPYGIRIEF